MDREREEEGNEASSLFAFCVRRTKTTDEHSTHSSLESDERTTMMMRCKQFHEKFPDEKDVDVRV